MAPSAVDWESRWSAEGAARLPVKLQALTTGFGGNKAVIGMHGGLPPAAAFPVTAFTMRLVDGSTVDVAAPDQVHLSQQYNLNMKGYAPLLDWCKSITADLQKPALPVDCVISGGSTSALESVLGLLLNPGDVLLVEQFTYAHVLDALKHRRFQMLGVPMDDEGMDPEALHALLCARKAAGLPTPKAMYVIPSGQNPTGAVMSAARIEAIYAVARAWDIIILEDDAYYWLQYPQGPEAVPGLQLPTRSLAVDTDGRVVRLDSFAKLLAPGLRLGWVTGPAALVTKLSLSINASSLGPSSLCQVMTGALLQAWGREGFASFVTRLQRMYAEKAQAAVAAAERHLSGVATWRPIKAGMFMWGTLSQLADSNAVLDAAKEAGVVVVPGHYFAAPEATLNPIPAAFQRPKSITLAAPSDRRPLFGTAAGVRGHLQRTSSLNDDAGTKRAYSQRDNCMDAWITSKVPLKRSASIKVVFSSARIMAPIATSSEESCASFRVSFVSVSLEQIEEGFKRLRAAIDATQAAQQSVWCADEALVDEGDCDVPVGRTLSAAALAA